MSGSVGTGRPDDDDDIITSGTHTTLGAVGTRPDLIFLLSFSFFSRLHFSPDAAVPLFFFFVTCDLFEAHAFGLLSLFK